MYSTKRRGKGTAFLAVLQSLLLLTALVLVPASAIAQDGHHSQVDLAEDIVKANADHPKGSLGDRGFKLRLFPQQPKVAVNGKVVVSAWVCPGWDKTPFGGPKGDGKPGGDDTCKPIKAEWSVEGPATLANHKALKTRLVLNADGAVRLTAEVDDLKQSTKITVKKTAAKNRGSDAAAIVKKAAQKEAKAAKVKAQKAAARQAAAEQAAKAAAAEQAAAAQAAAAQAAAAAAKPAAPAAEPAQVASPAAEPVVEAPIVEAPAAEEPAQAPVEESVPAEEPAAEEPAEEPAAEEPAEEPAAEEPAAEEPAEEPAAEEPAAEEPAEEPAAEQPAAEEPAEEPAAEEPAAEEPAEEPAAEQPAAEEPAEEPAAEEPAAEEPAEEPAAEEPAEEPSPRSPLKSRSQAEEPAAEEPAEEPVAEEPAAEEPAEEPVAEEPAEEPVAEEPAAEEPAAEEPAEEPVAEEPAEEPVAEEPAAEEPAEEPVAEEPAAEVPAEEPVAEAAEQVAVEPQAVVAPAATKKITARKWGSGYTELKGAEFGLWNGALSDTNFSPGTPDETCVTGATGEPSNGTCEFDGLSNGTYTIREISNTDADYNIVEKWAPGPSGDDNDGVAYQRVITISNQSQSNTDTRWFANRRDNPPFPTLDCKAPFEIVMVLDSSGSIGRNDPAKYQKAATDFVNSLVGTNTEIAIVEFSDTASLKKGLTSIQGGQNGVVTAIAQVYASNGGATNWADALDEAAGITSTAGVPRIVLVITDGNPTVNPGDSGSGGTVSWYDFTDAVTEANVLKAANQRIVALGAGPSGTISEEGLIGISGPVTGGSALTNDYFIGNVDQLAQELKELALARCGASLKVKKVKNDGDGFQNAENWGFNISVSGDPDVTPGTTNQKTNSNGNILFEWVSATTRTVTITERTDGPAADYAAPEIACYKSNDFSGTPLTPDATTARSWTFDIPSEKDYSCKFKNSLEQGKIKLRKVWEGTSGSTTLKIGETQGGSEIVSKPVTGNDATAWKDVPSGKWYFLSEQGGLADYTTTFGCTGQSDGPVPINDTNYKVKVGPSGEVVCEFTNTRKEGSIELKKKWVGTGGQTTLDIGTTVGGSEVDTQLTGAAGAAPLTTGANDVDTGTYYVSETGGLADYTSELDCTRNGDDFTPGIDGEVTVGAEDVVVCEFTNTRKEGSIELKKKWVGTGGQTTLDIGTTVGGSEVDTQLTGAAGAAPLTTGANDVDTGTYYVSETGGLADYTSELDCTRNGDDFTPGIDGEVTVGAEDVVVCEFTNTRKEGSIELKKKWVGTGGQTTLDIGTTVGGSEVDTQLTGAAGAAPLTTGANDVDTGTYYVSETGGLADYTSELDCTRNGDDFTPGIDGEVTVGAEDVVVCEFTNTRKEGSIELKKKWVGTGGQTTLDIGTTVGGSEVDTQLTGAAGAAPLTTGANDVDTGTYYVSETGGLADYTSELDCTRNGDDFTPGIDGEVTVGAEDVVVCEFTNTRKEGSIELKKKWVGTGGQTTLDIGTTVGGSEVDTQLTGAAGAAPLTTGANDVDTGTYYVSETGGLADYTSELDCTRNGDDFTPGIDGEVTVGAEDVVVCEFTNTRKEGSIELKKKWVGTGGQTTLDIGTTVGGSEVDTQLTGAAGAAPLTTGANDVDTGTYYVSETGGLADYTSELDCTRNGDDFTPGIDGEVTVGAEDVVVCEFTNTRKEGSIELKKKWVGTGGQTTLDIGTTVGGSEVDTQLTGAAGAAPLTTGANDVDTGTYYVSETGGLADYTSELDCTRNGDDFTPGIDGEVTVGAEDVVVCEFTNTRDTGMIEVIKDLKPADDSGKFLLYIQGVYTTGPVGDEGTTGKQTVDTGTYTVGEFAADGTNPDKYTSSISCVDREAPEVAPAVSLPGGPSMSVTVNKGDDIVCTVTNLLRDIEIKKWSEPDYYTAAGQTITFYVEVENTGYADQTDVQVTDLLDGMFEEELTCVPPEGSTLAGKPDAGTPGDKMLCKATYVTTEDDVKSGKVRNSVCVASDQSGIPGISEPPVQPTAEVIEQPERDPVCDETTVPYADIDIEKPTNDQDADAPTGPVVAVGAPITWKYIVTNTGDVALSNVTVTDDKLADDAAAIDCGAGNNVIASLAVGQTKTCTANGTAVAGQYTNTGSVIGTPPGKGSPPTDTDPSNYFGAAPGIDIEKLTNGENADNPTGPGVQVGEPITWTYEVTNTGNVTLTGVTVTDDQGVVVSCPKSTLVAGKSMTCTASGTATAGQYVNTGTATGIPPVGVAPSDSDKSHYFGIEVEVESTPLPTESLKPTDMLFTTDTIGPADDGDPMGALFNWALWLALSALLIVGTAAIIRRERYAEVKTRR